MADQIKALRGRGNPQRKPGPKVGQRHSGQFKPGHDPRRWMLGPRKGKDMKDLERLCRESAADALGFLLDTVNDSSADKRVRLQAAREILDRGYGKPVDRQAVLSLSAGGESADKLDRDALLRIAAGAYENDPAQVLEFRGKTPPADDLNGDDEI